MDEAAGFSLTIDLANSIFVLGIVFWLAGGARWVEQKVRSMKLDNDFKKAELDRIKTEKEDETGGNAKT